MSKESPPVREVVPFKPGKRQSTFRKLNLDFAGTALEEALARQQQEQEAGENRPKVAEMPPLTPVTGVRGANTKKKLTPVTGLNQEAAPKKDFTRAANSIVRDAIPAGVFTGKGKHLYDYLYSQTRGAITPIHAARIPTEKVMKGAGMTRNTFRFHLERLCNSGLIRVDQRPGEHGGNIYTVLLPEEAGLQRGDRGHPGENLPLVQGSEVDPSHLGSNPTDSDTYGSTKTFIKTKDINTDDEAFAEFAAAVRKTAKEITGREPSKAEAARWAEVAEVLMTELKIAAGRTTVSNVPAFLAEHLRRRLWKKEKRQIEAEAAEQKSSTIAQKVDTSQCPDCFGTGMHYPEGFDKGVARCTHTKLIGQSEG